MMNNKGFTIIELLIAASILAFMITGMTIAMQQQQRQMNFTKELVDIDQTGRAILDFISTDIRNAAARQGKHFSIKFINGGSPGCDLDSDLVDDNTNNSGTEDSPPDCLTVYLWDITRGMTAALGDGNTVMPSISVTPTIKSAVGSTLKFDLPDEWFVGGEFIGGTLDNNEILLGTRSRVSICNPTNSINCLATPEKCGECAMVLKGSVNFEDKDLTILTSDFLIEENLPVSFSSVNDLISGVTNTSPGDGEKYGLINTITSLASEISLVKTRTFKVDTTKRSLLVSQDGSEFISIGGGESYSDVDSNFAGGLEAPGIVDLQFVFNVQNQDGSVTKVGACDESNGSLSCNCSDTNKDTYENFGCTPVLGREQDIRTVEIYLVLKSKIKPKKQAGGLYKQSIPVIADVEERDFEGGTQSVFFEPEEGYIYRVMSTTVYVRNMAREDFG